MFQDKFVNYWANGQPNSNPAVLSVNIKSEVVSASLIIQNIQQSN